MGPVTVSMSSEKQPKGDSTTSKKKGPTPEECLAGNLQQNRARKQDFKRMKKERKRLGKGTSKIDNILVFLFHVQFSYFHFVCTKMYV